MALLPWVCLAGLLGVLGVWQWQRALSKQQLQDDVARRAAMPPAWLDAELLRQAPAALAWRPVRLTGNWSAGPTLLLDNRVVASQAGYAVLTPLSLPGGGPSVLVEWTWLPIERRDVVPRLSAPPLLQGQLGSIVPLPPRNRWRAETPAETMAPGLWRVQALAHEQLLRWLGPATPAFTVRLGQPAAPSGALADTIGPARHRAYALQWWLLSLLALVYGALGSRRLGFAAPTDGP